MHQYEWSSGIDIFSVHALEEVYFRTKIIVKIQRFTLFVGFDSDLKNGRGGGGLKGDKWDLKLFFKV